MVAKGPRPGTRSIVDLGHFGSRLLFVIVNRAYLRMLFSVSYIAKLPLQFLMRKAKPVK